MAQHLKALASANKEEGKMTAAEMEIKEILDSKTAYEPRKFMVKSMSETLGLPEGATPMYIVTSPDYKFGGYGILNKDAQREVQSRLGERQFFAIPSSIHEFICVPVDCGTAMDLLKMVIAVNASQVEEQDRIADALYYFDGENLQYAKEEA